MAGAACGGDGQRRGEGVGKGTFKPSDGKERLGEERWWPGRGPSPEEREPGACGTGARGPDSRSCREIGARGVCARVRVSGRAGWRRPAEAGAADVVTGLRSPSCDFPASGVRVSDSSAAASFSPSSPHPPPSPFSFLLPRMPGAAGRMEKRPPVVGPEAGTVVGCSPRLCAQVRPKRGVFPVLRAASPPCPMSVLRAPWCLAGLDLDWDEGQRPRKHVKSSTWKRRALRSHRYFLRFLFLQGKCWSAAKWASAGRRCWWPPT